MSLAEKMSCDDRREFTWDATDTLTVCVGLFEDLNKTADVKTAGASSAAEDGSGAVLGQRPLKSCVL